MKQFTTEFGTDGLDLLLGTTVGDTHWHWGSNEIVEGPWCPGQGFFVTTSNLAARNAGDMACLLTVDIGFLSGSLVCEEGMLSFVIFVYTTFQLKRH